MNETIKATLTADGSQFQREFQKSQSTVTNFQKGMATAAKAIGTFFAGRALLNTFNAMRNEIDELGKTATRLRMPVEQVQILSVAADQGGTDIDNLVKALNRAQVAATEAGRGTATYTREFDALNINIAEFQKLNHQDRLNVLADAYGNAADKGEAFTSLSRIMGRSVSDLIPLLEGGSKALEELAGKVNVVDESQVRRIEEFNDRITLLSGNLKSNLMEAFMALEPQMNSFAKNLGTSFEMIGTIFDDAGGVGRKGDFADVLQTLREINALGGEGNEGKGLGKKYETLNKRFAESNELLKIQARQFLEIQKHTESFKSGAFSREVYDYQIQKVKGLAEESRKIVAIEEAKKIEMQEITATMEEQKKLAESLASMEERESEKLEKRLLAMKELREQMEALKEQARPLGNVDASPEEMQRMKEQANATEDPEQRLKMIQDMNRLLEIREEIEKVQDKINRSTEESTRTIAEEARRAATEKQRELEAAQEIEKLKQAQNMARADFAAEMKALEFEVAGRKDLAEELRAEITLRAEAANLAERLGTSEEKALELLRKRAEIQREIARQDNEIADERGGIPKAEVQRGLGAGRRLDGRESNIKRSARNRNLAESFAERDAREAKKLMEDAALEDMGRKRRMQGRGDIEKAAADESKKFWTEQLSLQERLVKHFDRLAAI